MSTIPYELNWVEKRAACTSDSTFLQLVTDIKQDVKARNASNASGNFAAELTSDNRTLIVGEVGTWARKEQLKIFPLNGKIEVRDEVKNTKFSAEVFLNDEGRCKLRIDGGKELERWQFRRLALEGLFFSD